MLHADFNSVSEVQKLRLDKIEPHAWSIEAHQGEKILKITIDSGDKRFKNTERSEIQDPLKLPLDEEAWYRINFKIPNDFPEVKSRVAIWQIKQSGSKSPLLSMYYMDGKLKLKQSFDDSKINYYQPKINYKNKWAQIIVHAKASTTKSGFLNVYLDDNQIIEYVGQTAHHSKLEHKTYFKFGLYRDVVDSPMYIYYDQYIRGSSMEDVVPEGFNPQIIKQLWKFKRKKS